MKSDVEAAEEKSCPGRNGNVARTEEQGALNLVESSLLGRITENRILVRLERSQCQGEVVIGDLVKPKGALDTNPRKRVRSGESSSKNDGNAPPSR